MTDEELVERAKLGDREALDELVERHHGVVYRVALGILGDVDLAADVAQEAYLKALRALRGFRGESRFRTWLVAIAANEAKGALRRAARRGERSLEAAAHVSAPADDPCDGVAAAKEEAQRVAELLAQLPEKQRLAVQLRTQDGLSFREVGELIGSSEGAARVNYHHGIRRLREMLK